MAPWLGLERDKKTGAKQIEIKTGNRKRKTWGPDAFDWSKSIPDGPLAHGFDSYFGDTVINFPPYCWIENDKVTAVPDRMMDTTKLRPIKEGNWEFRPGPTVEGWDPYDNIPTTTKRGVEFIKKQAESDEPFFLYFAFPAPHAPIIPNDKFDGKSKAGPYGDFVVETDDACGQLLKALKDSGQAENTIVVSQQTTARKDTLTLATKNLTTGRLIHCVASSVTFTKAVTMCRSSSNGLAMSQPAKCRRRW